jgi:hypothetical protein
MCATFRWTMVGFLSIILFGTGARADTIVFHNNDATLSTQDSSLTSEPLVAIKAINTVTIDRMGVLGDFTGSDGESFVSSYLPKRAG